jgi:hypothetical protein
MPKRKRETLPYQKDKERHYHSKTTRSDTTIPKRKRETLPYQKDKERHYHTKTTKTDTTIPKRQGERVPYPPYFLFGMVVSLLVVLVW